MNNVESDRPYSSRPSEPIPTRVAAPGGHLSQVLAQTGTQCESRKGHHQMANGRWGNALGRVSKCSIRRG